MDDLRIRQRSNFVAMNLVHVKKYDVFPKRIP
jgi:hypothetical protein